MKQILYNLIFSILLLHPCMGKAQVKSSVKPGVKISSGSLLIPIIKRASINPLIRIRIYVPPGNSIAYKSIGLTLDKNAIEAFDTLQVVNSFSEPTATNSSTVIATVVKPDARLEIPIEVEAKPGITYIFLLMKPKADADIDKKVAVHALHLTQSNGTRDTVAETDNSLEVKSSTIHRLGVAVRLPGDDGVNSYRIPGLTTTDKGTLVAVYDIRYNNSADLPGNIDVGMSRSTDGGKTWEPMKKIIDMGPPHENNGVGDPAILFDPLTKKLWVAALWSKGNRSIAGSEPGLSPDTTGQLVLVSSDDDGLTWSAPYSITTQVKDPKWHLYFNGPGAGIAMQNGTIVFASQYWDESRKPGIPHSAIIYSQDHGQTWKRGTGAKSNTTESQVIETKPGILMLNMRDNRGKFRSIATTNDMGKTWIEHYTSYQALQDPVCMAGLLKAKVSVKGKMQDVVFFSNVNSSTARFNTTIKASLDLGETWLPQNEVALDIRNSWGYSSITRIDDYTIGILYEGTGGLLFLRVPVSDIIK